MTPQAVTDRSGGVALRKNEGDGRKVFLSQRRFLAALSEK